MTEITLAESKRLVELEEVIERGLSTFKEVGEALSEVRDMFSQKSDGRTDRWASIGYTNFEDYCIKKWKFSRYTAYNLMNASEVVQNIKTALPTPAQNVERSQHLTDVKQPNSVQQALHLRKLPAAAQPKAWAAAVSAANGSQPTAAQVAVAVEAVQEETTPKRERAFCPSNGMRYADLAIDALKKIQPNDTERDKAFMAVQRFLTQTYQAK